QENPHQADPLLARAGSHVQPHRRTRIWITGHLGAPLSKPHGRPTVAPSPLLKMPHLEVTQDTPGARGASIDGRLPPGRTAGVGSPTADLHVRDGLDPQIRLHDRRIEITAGP